MFFKKQVKTTQKFSLKVFYFLFLKIFYFSFLKIKNYFIFSNYQIFFLFFYFIFKNEKLFLKIVAKLLFSILVWITFTKREKTNKVSYKFNKIKNIYSWGCLRNITLLCSKNNASYLISNKQTKKKKKEKTIIQNQKLIFENYFQNGS